MNRSPQNPDRPSPHEELGGRTHPMGDEEAAALAAAGLPGPAQDRIAARRAAIDADRQHFGMSGVPEGGRVVDAETNARGLALARRAAEAATLIGYISQGLGPDEIARRRRIARDGGRRR